MNCSEAKLKLEPCASGTLPPEERIELEEHLAICEGCRLELELTRAVLGTPSFEGTDEPPPMAPAPPAEAAPPFGSAPPALGSVPPAFGSAPPALEATPPALEPRPVDPPTLAGLDEEISFANLELDSPSTPTMAGATPGGSTGAHQTDAPASSRPPGGEAQPAANMWDFEPAEVPRDSSPPEGSLSFANEALKRKREAEVKRKAMLLRLALWGGGIGCGLVLLGVSVWIALAFRQGQPDSTMPPVKSPQPTTQTAPPAQTAVPPTAEPPATSTATEGGAPSMSTTAPSNPAPTAAAPSNPASAGTSTTPQPTLLDATPGVAPSPGPPPTADTRIAADGSTKHGPTAKKPKPKTSAGGTARPTPTARKPVGNGGDEGEFPWRPVDDKAPPPVAASNPVVKETPGVAPPTTGESAPTVPPQAAPSNPAGSSPSGPGGQTAGSATAPNASAQPSETPPSTNEGAAPASTPTDQANASPVERLHLATETAAKNKDLDALRKLKSSWKAFIKSAAGPERARAKREFADCLWETQELTGRDSDRREALAAYRDYVLYAPAGGTDPRTVSRMRSLEDILSDSK